MSAIFLIDRRRGKLESAFGTSHGNDAAGLQERVWRSLQPTYAMLRVNCDGLAASRIAASLRSKIVSSKIAETLC